MPLQSIEKLDELISFYILEVQKLKAENDRLSGRVKALTDELDEFQSQRAVLQLGVDKLTALKTTHRKMESDREKARGMVRGILRDLEKINVV